MEPRALAWPLGENLPRYGYEFALRDSPRGGADTLHRPQALLRRRNCVILRFEMSFRFGCLMDKQIQLTRGPAATDQFFVNKY